MIRGSVYRKGIFYEEFGFYKEFRKQYSLGSIKVKREEVVGRVVSWISREWSDCPFLNFTTLVILKTQ